MYCIFMYCLLTNMTVLNINNYIEYKIVIEFGIFVCSIKEKMEQKYYFVIFSSKGHLNSEFNNRI